MDDVIAWFEESLRLRCEVSMSESRCCPLSVAPSTCAGGWASSSAASCLQLAENNLGTRMKKRNENYGNFSQIPEFLT